MTEYNGYFSTSDFPFTLAFNFVRPFIFYYSFEVILFYYFSVYIMYLSHLDETYLLHLTNNKTSTFIYYYKWSQRNS